MSDNDVYQAGLEVLILSAIIAKDGRQDTEQRLRAFGVDITAPQYRLLRQLQQGRYTIKELSRVMMVEPATLVPMVDTLERHGLVRRRRDPNDRRRMPVELTETGLTHLNRVPFVHESDPIARYLSTLTEDDRQVFLRRLRELVDALHGSGVTRFIAGGVHDYFAFGEQQEALRPPTHFAKKEPLS